MIDWADVDHSRERAARHHREQAVHELMVERRWHAFAAIGLVLGVLGFSGAVGLLIVGIAPWISLVSGAVVLVSVIVTAATTRQNVAEARERLARAQKLYDDAFARMVAEEQAVEG